MYGFKKGAKPEQDAKLPKGGKIQGPGTGTSDSIKAEIPKGSYIMPADSTQQIGPKALGELGQPVPVNVSNGEYQMPPEQVHAVGVHALNQMRDATHTPVAAGFKPQKGGLYFADGGLIADAAQYWANDNEQFEAGNPSFGSRVVRALNPATSFGSAMGAMHTAAGSGDKTGMALAAAQAIPVFGAMRSVITPAMGAVKAARAMAPSAAQTGAAIAGSGAAGAMADAYGSPAVAAEPQQPGVAFSDMQREPNIPRREEPRLGFADGGSPAEEERRRLPGSPLAVTYGDMTGRPSARTATQPQQAATVMPSVSYGDLQRTPNLPRPSAPNPSGAINTAVEARPRAQMLEQAPAQVAELGTEPDQAPQRAPASFASMQREPSIPRAGQPRPMPQGEPVTVSDLAQGFRAGGQAVADRVAGAGRAAVSGAADAAAGFRAGGQEATNQIAAAGRGLAQAAGGALGQAFPNTLTAVRGAGQNIGEAYQAGGFPAAVGATVRNTLVPAIGFAADVGRGAQTVLDPAANALRTAVTGDPTPIGGAAQENARALSPIAPASASPAQQPAQQPPAQPPVSATPQPDPREMGPAQGMTVRPTSAAGINRIDNAPGLASPLFTNLPTGQAVSEMQGGTVNTVPAFRAPASTQPSGAAMGFSPEREGPSGGVIGAGRTEQDRYGALMREVARLSQGGRAGRNKAAALVSAYQAAQRGEDADMRDQAGMRELGFRQEDAATRNALAARELQERSADRTGRFALDERRLAGDERMRGFEARGLERVERLYAAYENAKTPEERAAAAEQLRTLSGKEAPNRYTVVPGGQEVTEQGMLRTVPARVLNNQTGQFVDHPASAQALPPIAENPAVQRIMQNTALSREERAAQIRALGYK